VGKGLGRLAANVEGECNNGGRRLKGGELDWKRQPRAIAKHQKINGENPFAFLFAHLIIDISVQIEGRPFFICSRLPHDLRNSNIPPFLLDSNIIKLFLFMVLKSKFD
jgi:hypothetical protein